MTKTKPRKKPIKACPSKQNGCYPKQHPTKAEIIKNEKTTEITIDKLEKQYIIPFLELIATKTEQAAEKYCPKLYDTIKEDPRTIKAAEYARQHDIKIPFEKPTPKASSRIERLIKHNLITTARSYVENTDTKKEQPNYHIPKAVFGATDKQIMTIENNDDDNTIAYEFWCITDKIRLTFAKPDYAQEYDIAKHELLTIMLEKDGTVRYDIPFEERLSYDTNRYNHCYLGVDLGRIEPFVATAINHKGDVIGVFHASSRLKELNSRRERLIRQKKDILRKLDYFRSRESLSVDEMRKMDRLVEENCRVRGKISSLGDEVAELIGHEVGEVCRLVGVACCAVEDLGWVSEHKSGSRWVHGKARDWVARCVNRAGAAFFVVDARDSSNTCVGCGHVGLVCRGRDVVCPVCGCVGDRDVFASFVIAFRGRERYFGFLAGL